MHRLECAPIDGDQLTRKQVALLTQERAGAADLPQCIKIVAAKLGNCLMVRSELLQQPHQCDSAVRLLR
jgi:hypothetical protein